MARYQVVVATENTALLSWQAMLFHYSCLHYLGHRALFVVHTDERPLLSGFQRIAAAGATVQIAPNYRRVGGVNYPPRNTAATLRHAETEADFLVLCDADMIFLQPLAFDQALTADRQISVDHVGYLDPDSVESIHALECVCPLAGVSLEQIRAQPCRGGVPHVIPRRWQRPLSDDWLQCLEWFPTIPPWPAESAGALSRDCHKGPQKVWLAAMWALVLAVHRLGLEPVMTNWCITNYQGTRPLPPLQPTGPELLHYCYADAGFNKHAFDDLTSAEETVWQVPPDDGTVSGAVRKQLREARTFYLA